MNSNYIQKTVSYNNEELFSVSKLKTYSLCSKYYEYQYVLKLGQYSYSYSTLLGSICHNSLEEHNLTKEELLTCLDNNFISTLITSNVIKEEINKDIILHLKEYNKIIQGLYYKASSSYKGEDAIRTKSGSIPKNPTQTSSWKEMLEEKGGSSLKEDIDNYFFKYAIDDLNFNVSDLYGDCYRWLSVYKKPAEELEVLAVEFGISHLDRDNNEIINPCYINNTDLLRGYIDKVGIYQVDNEKGIGLIDYKTSATQMEEMHVKNNEQLYIYVYAYEQVTGQEVKFIGIENIKFQTVNIVKVDRDKLEEIVKNFFFRIKMIKERMFYKEHSPDSVYSKCLDSYGKVCPYLNQCYPDTHRELNQISELEAMLKSL